MNPKELREQAVKDAKCGLILNAAQQVFKEKGVWNSRVEDIAAAAGFSKPTLYNYYPDKESIIISLAIRELQVICEKLASVAKREAPFVNNIEECFRIILTQISESFSMFMDLSDYHQIALLSLHVAKNAELARRFQQMKDEIQATFVTLIEKGVASGEIESTLPVELLTQIAMVMTHAIHTKWKMTGKIDDIEVVTQQLGNFVRYGFSINSQNK